MHDRPLHILLVNAFIVSHQSTLCVPLVNKWFVYISHYPYSILLFGKKLQGSLFKPALITVTRCVHSCAPASYSFASSYLPSTVFVYAFYISLTHYQLQLSTGEKSESGSKNILTRKLCVCTCVCVCVRTSIVMSLHSEENRLSKPVALFDGPTAVYYLLLILQALLASANPV